MTTDDLLKKMMWAGDDAGLARPARCVCCCDEHTYDDCPARRWYGCRGQGSELLTVLEIEGWFRAYSRTRGFTREQFFEEGTMLIRLSPNAPVASISCMTDSEVIDAVQKALRAYASAVTCANRAHQRAGSAAFSFFGSTDVEQAARNNAIQRAELMRSEAIELAADKRRVALAAIRANAGAWVDLVPETA
jgi:hypothetical protein